MSELNSYSYRETSDILILVNRSYVDAFNFSHKSLHKEI